MSEMCKTRTWAARRRLTPWGAGVHIRCRKTETDENGIDLLDRREFLVAESLRERRHCRECTVT